MAYGKGDGTFAAEPGPSWKGPGSASVYTSIGEVRPLAIGHLNDDGVLDFVDTQGIHLSQIAGQGGNGGSGQGGNGGNADVTYETVAAPPIGATWDQALIVDLNGNGMIDVVAASSASAGLDFYNGAGGGLFGYAKVPTTGAPKHLAIGDFDGDLLSDLAIAEQGSVEVGGDALSVLFGQPAGAPALPISFGRLGEIRQIVPENTVQVGQTAIDAMTDLAVISYASAESSTSRLSFFAGTSNRLLESPYYIYTEAEKVGAARRIASPRHVVLGRFSGNDAHLDVAVAGREANKAYGLWLLSSTGPAALFSQPDRAPLPDGIDQLEDAHLVPIDFGPTPGTDSLVLLTRWNGGDDPKVPSAVTIARSDGARWAYDKPMPIGEDVAIGGGFSGQALPCDVDGDGLLDIIATGSGTPGSAIILWNDGTSGIDASKRTIIANPDPTATATAAGEAGPVTSVACLRADRDGAGEMAIVLSRRVPCEGR